MTKLLAILILTWYLILCGQSIKKIVAFSKENSFSWTTWRFVLTDLCLEIAMVFLWILIIEGKI